MFSTHKLWIAALALLGVFTVFSGSVNAQKIGVVDGTQVLNDYSEAKKADAQLKELAKMWNDTVKSMNDDAMSKVESYKKTFETMTKEAQAKAQADVNAMQDAIMKYQSAKFDQNNGELAQARIKLLQPILEKIKDVVATTAKKKKIDIIIDAKQTAIYFSDAVTDITKDVSSALK